VLLEKDISSLTSSSFRKRSAYWLRRRNISGRKKVRSLLSNLKELLEKGKKKKKGERGERRVFVHKKKTGCCHILRESRG